MKMSLLARLLNRKSTLESGLKPPPAQHAAVAGRSATAGQTDSVAAITALANQQFQAGELNSARDLYKRILELDPGSARAYIHADERAALRRRKGTLLLPSD